jgi:Rab GDP dissociation inhibitor
MQLYFNSIMRFGKSPYIYPLYGLGELPQAFARLSAVYGGTYMLRKPFEGLEYDESGKAVGVKSEGQVAKCKFVVGDPSYFPEKVQKSGQIARCICFLSAPPVKGVGSAQIIVPAKQINRKSDMYISYVSDSHNVVPKGKYIGIVSALVETDNPELELKPGLDLLGNIVDKFMQVSDLFEPKEDGKADGVFISKSFDQTSHFETTCLDILDMYKRITGKDLDLSGADLSSLREDA